MSGSILFFSFAEEAVKDGNGSVIKKKEASGLQPD